MSEPQTQEKEKELPTAGPAMMSYLRELAPFLAREGSTTTIGPDNSIKHSYKMPMQAKQALVGAREGNLPDWKGLNPEDIIALMGQRDKLDQQARQEPLDMSEILYRNRLGAAADPMNKIQQIFAKSLMDQYLKQVAPGELPTTTRLRDAQTRKIEKEIDMLSADPKTSAGMAKYEMLSNNMRALGYSDKQIQRAQNQIIQGITPVGEQAFQSLKSILSNPMGSAMFRGKKSQKVFDGVIDLFGEPESPAGRPRETVTNNDAAAGVQALSDGARADQIFDDAETGIIRQAVPGRQKTNKKATSAQVDERREAGGPMKVAATIPAKDWRAGDIPGVGKLTDVHSTWAILATEDGQNIVVRKGK
jgi:hypothetical protein